MVEITGPIALKDNEKRIVYGPVLIPDEPDSDGDVVKAERIETVAHAFTENYGNVDLQHSLNNIGRLVESYILPVDLPVDNGDVVPKGSWMLGARVTDADAWQAVLRGDLTGFSIMAVQGRSAAGKSAVKDRVTLADLGDDWIVNAVSLVDAPAVPRAKFLAIKSKKPEATKAVSLSQLENLLDPTMKEGGTVDEETLRNILEELLNPLREQVNTIAQQVGDANTSENASEDSAGDEQGNGTAAKQDETPPPPSPEDETGEQATDQSDDAQEPSQQGEDDEAAATTGEIPTLSPEELAQLRELLGTLNAEQTPDQQGNQVQVEELATGKSTGHSMRITGQDNQTTEKSDTNPEPDRDSFGRKIR